MVYKIINTKAAEQDLDSIVSYISVQLHSPQAANHFLQSVFNAYRELESNPYLYTFCLDQTLAKQEYRRVIIKNYILVYKIRETKKQIIIYRFFHGSQSYNKFL